MNKKVVLLGSNGQLGYELKRVLPLFGEVKSICKREFDYLNFSELKSFIYDLKPNLIVNASAYTHVDKAESDNINAYLLNEQLPSNLAKLAKDVGASFVHYSTDYVFKGDSKTPYIETDTVDPQCVYGKSKLAGENKIIESGCDYVILRTAWLYGHYGKNFYKKMIELAKEKEVLKIVDDQIGCPTSARLVAILTSMMLQSCKDGFQDKSGIYHLVCSGQCSWYDFAKLIIEQSVSPIQRKVKEILPVASSQYFTLAKRPSYSVLNTNKFQKTFDVCIPNWADVFAQHIEDRDWSILDE